MRLAARTRRSTVPPGQLPVIHAATGHHTGHSARSSYAAVCGAAIVMPSASDREAGFPEMFDPSHPRACRVCAGGRRGPAMTVAPGLCPSKVRRCRVCGVVVGRMVPIKGSPSLSRWEPNGKAGSPIGREYRCVNHPEESDG